MVGVFLVSLLALSLPIVRTVSAGQAGAPLSNAVPILEDLGKKIQDQHRSEAERLDLIKTLGDWGTAQVRPPLLIVLNDPLPAIRAAAARALGWRGNSEAVVALRDRIARSDETSAAKAAALESLGRIGDDSGRAVVLAFVRDPDDKIRQAALWGVTFGALVKPADRFPFLRQVAEDRGMDLQMRCEAIGVLGESKDAEATELLMRLLAHEPAIPMPMPSEGASQQELMMARYREARDVRAWAAGALGLIKAKAALPLLLQSAEAPDDFFLRLASVQVSWNIPEARPVLVRRLGDPFADIRQIALVGLAKAGDRSVVGAVMALLSDPNPRVRAQAVIALADLGDPRARPDLETLRQTDTSADVQRALDRVLAPVPR
jgi:HEAT repeat protein